MPGKSPGTNQGVGTLNFGAVVLSGAEANRMLVELIVNKQTKDKYSLWDEVVSPLLDKPIGLAKEIESTASRMTVCNSAGVKCFSAEAE
jgi:hypothetical protein